MEDKIIMYDSDDAARLKTVSGWVSSSGFFYGNDEHLARWAGCTHLKCECGNIMEKGWTLCDECRHKKSIERYNALPFKKWDGVEYVCTWDGDKYFFGIEELEEWMFENEFEEIDLLICDPIYYDTIDSETVASNAHEDWEPGKDLLDAIKKFNAAVKKLPAHSWMPGKIRTNHKIENKKP